MALLAYLLGPRHKEDRPKSFPIQGRLISGALKATAKTLISSFCHKASGASRNTSLCGIALPVAARMAENSCLGCQFDWPALPDFSV